MFKNGPSTRKNGGVFHLPGHKTPTKQRSKFSEKGQISITFCVPLMTTLFYLWPTSQGHFLSDLRRQVASIPTCSLHSLEATSGRPSVCRVTIPAATRSHSRLKYISTNFMALNLCASYTHQWKTGDRLR